MIMQKKIPVVACALVLAVYPVGCGDSETTTTGASQEELAQAREEGAEEALQEQQVRELKRKVRKLSAQQRENDGDTTVVSPTTTTSTPATGSGGDWSGGSGYTAILASVGSEGEARSLQSQATSVGLDAGVLNSSDYSSLRPGYWVVFSGQYQTESEAADRAQHAHELGYSQAYPRFVSP